MGVPAAKIGFKKPEFVRISDVIWDVLPTFKQGMRVPARIIATKKLIDAMDLQVYDQISNVATLPGIQKFAFTMPDGHSGYGFPIGGVAAFDVNEGGVISPGGIGFDINCGMRLVLTNLTYDQVKPELRTLVEKLFYRVPAGVGSRGFIRVSHNEFREQVAMRGAQWAVESGYGWPEDLERTELHGKAEWADSSKISPRSVERGFNQIGTLGSGNHYLEIQRVKSENIFNKELAAKWGLFPGSDRNHVPLRVAGIRAPGGFRLSRIVFVDHGIEIRDQDPRPGACLRSLSFPGRAGILQSHGLRR